SDAELESAVIALGSALLFGAFSDVPGLAQNPSPLSPLCCPGLKKCYFSRKRYIGGTLCLFLAYLFLLFGLAGPMYLLDLCLCVRIEEPYEFEPSHSSCRRTAVGLPDFSAGRGPAFAARRIASQYF